MGVNVVNYSYKRARLYPIDDAYPEEIDYDIEVESDISGDDITGEDIWELDDGTICSQKEMIEMFFEDFVTDVSEEEYEEAKHAFIKDFSIDSLAAEDMFADHPKMIKVDLDDGEIHYFLKDSFDPIEDDMLPKDWRLLDQSDLEEIAFDDFDPEDDYENYLANQADDYNDERWMEEHSIDED